MRFRERWKTAGTIAQEIRFTGYLDANPSNLSRIKEKPERIISQIKRGSAINSILTGFVILMIGISMVAFLFYFGTSGNTWLQFAISLSIFFGIGFVLILFMNLIYTSGFFSTNAMVLPSTLPFSRPDLEGLMLLAFARLFIIPIIMLLVIYPLLIGAIFGLLTGIFVLAALAATSVLALGALIRVSGWFYSKSQSGSESKFSTIVRVGAGLGMMLGILVSYSAINFIPALVNFIITLSSVAGDAAMIILALVFPFSFGFVAATLTYSLVFSLPTTIASISASAVYFYLGFRSYVSSGKTLRSLATGGISSSAALSTSPIDLNISSKLLALVRKDFRIATRSLGSIMLLILPFLMIFAILPTLYIGNVAEIRSMSVIYLVSYVIVFGAFAMIGLLGLDTQGASVYEGLPLRTMMVLNGKIALFSVSYLFSLCTVFVILLVSSLTSPYLLFIPLFQIPCAYSLGAAVGGTIYRVRGGGRVAAVNLVGDQAMSFLALIVSGSVGLLPLLGYGLVLLGTGSHLLSILAQLSVSLGEALILRISLPHILKD
jgi:predicted permease